MTTANETAPAAALDARRRRQLAAFALYAVAALALLAIGATSIAAAFDDWAGLDDARRRLGDLDARPASPRSAAGAAAMGDILLRAKTAGVAAADLQQRVETAAHAVGAKTLSSRVDLQDGVEAKGALAYLGEIELDAASLQPLLYDLEAGTPLVEIAELSIRPLPDAALGERLRVSLSITAEWRPDP